MKLCILSVQLIDRRQSFDFSSIFTSQQWNVIEVYARTPNDIKCLQIIVTFCVGTKSTKSSWDCSMKAPNCVHTIPNKRLFIALDKRFERYLLIKLSTSQSHKHISLGRRNKTLVDYFFLCSASWHFNRNNCSHLTTRRENGKPNRTIDL